MSQPKTPLKENSFDSPEHRKLFETGLQKRQEVLGEDYVERSLANGSSDFLRPIQQYATEAAWGSLWTRPGLTPRDRSLLVLGMLTAQGKMTELGGHVRGAVRNGLTEIEIREALLQSSAYCGFPAAFEAFRVADRVLNEMEEKGEIKRER